MLGIKAGAANEQYIHSNGNVKAKGKGQKREWEKKKRESHIEKKKNK